MFPPETPLAGVNVDKLARLNVAGGSIRNIALHAAFLAADQGEAVRMTQLEMKLLRYFVARSAARR